MEPTIPLICLLLKSDNAKSGVSNLRLFKVVEEKSLEESARPLLFVVQEGFCGTGRYR